nr:hypothetical protein GCM10020093_100770 [Planobispora longispora]
MAVMDYAIPTGTILVTGVVLALVAQWKGWRPSLPVVLAVGIGFRVLIMAFAAESEWQPVDFVESFKPAGDAVLRGQDPVIGSEGGWHFLPMIPYVYGLLLWLGIPWEWGGRLVTVVADIILIPLVGKLAGGAAANLRAFQYACNPWRSSSPRSTARSSRSRWSSASRPSWWPAVPATPTVRACATTRSLWCASGCRPSGSAARCATWPPRRAPRWRGRSPRARASGTRCAGPCSPGC